MLLPYFIPLPQRVCPFRSLLTHHYAKVNFNFFSVTKPDLFIMVYNPNILSQSCILVEFLRFSSSCSDRVDTVSPEFSASVHTLHSYWNYTQCARSHSPHYLLKKHCAVNYFARMKDFWLSSRKPLVSIHTLVHVTS